MDNPTEYAILAGGCFWCMQPVFDNLSGVVSTQVGFSGGEKLDPTYDEVCGGGTGHREVIQVHFDPSRVTYREIIRTFLRTIDPTQADGQFSDRGEHYKTAIYFTNSTQEEVARQEVDMLEESGKFSEPIATDLLPALPFYSAEEYHQRYYLKNPEHYAHYAEGSGRRPFLRKNWGKN